LTSNILHCLCRYRRLGI